MATYADLERAKRELNLVDGHELDDPDIVLLGEIDAEVSRTIELKCGRRWGEIASATARTIDGPSVARSDVLPLPTPLRSVTSVAITGSNPETLASTAYCLWHETRELDAHALRRIDGGSWPIRNGRDRVVVTALWSDGASDATVPAEIVAATTFVVVETFRQKKSSPAGEIGPEGFSIRPRNPWGWEVVKNAIAKYGAAQPVVSF